MAALKPWQGHPPLPSQAAGAAALTHLVLFDIDGTLLGGDPAQPRGLANRHQHEAFRVALRECWGVAGGLEDVEHAGKTDQWILRDLHAHTRCALPVEAAIAAAAARMEAHCAAAGSPGEGLAVLPGVPALLAALAQRSATVACGLVTGNLQSIALRKLRALGLDAAPGAFVCGGFGSDAEDRAELVRVAVARARAALPGLRGDLRVFHVGDTPRDLDAAHRAGVEGLGVATGKFSVAELTAASAACAGSGGAAPGGRQVVLESLADLQAVLQVLGLEA
jgi:phosphoglycolate phosphatase